MATYTSPEWDDELYVPRAGELACGYGVVDITTKAAKDDVLQFFYLPQRAVALRGMLQGADLDTGTEALEIDIGNSDDPDKYLNSGVLTGDVVTEHVTVAGIMTHLQGTFITLGVQAALTAPEGVLGTVIATANDGGTGKLALMIDYTTGRS
jgi:hypothetical protein